MTQFAKDILSSTGDAAVHLRKKLFRKHKVRVQPTPKLINALKKGKRLIHLRQWPARHFSITQLPATLQGTELEEVDIARLLSLEASPRQKASTKASSQSPEHSTTYSIKLIPGPSLWKPCLAPNPSSPSKHHLGITGSQKTSEKIRTVWDNNFLAPKIEISISEIFNRAFRNSMIGVPDKTIFNNKLREGILNRTAHLELPTAVKAVLDCPKNAK
jgi:hypothetical protein